MTRRPHCRSVKGTSANAQANKSHDEIHDEIELTTVCVSVHLLSRTPRTFLIHSPPYSQLLDLQSVHCGRMRYFTSLLHSLRADQWPGLTILPPRRASMQEMEQFHSREYLTFMQQIVRRYERHADTRAVEQVHPISESERATQERFGLLDDCCVFPELFDLVQFTVGGTLRAVECLMASHAARPLAPVTACHWGGGRHHGEAECAKGFCYCNDAVCACLQLLSSDAFSRVLYLDIDLHHGRCNSNTSASRLFLLLLGWLMRALFWCWPLCAVGDGVEQAFSASQSVFTCSFHHHAPGFFPTTGSLDTEGQGEAKYRSGRKHDDELIGRRKRRALDSFAAVAVVPFFLSACSTFLYTLESMMRRIACW